MEFTFNDSSKTAGAMSSSPAPARSSEFSTDSQTKKFGRGGSVSPKFTGKTSVSTNGRGGGGSSSSGASPKKSVVPRTERISNSTNRSTQNSFSQAPRIIRKLEELSRQLTPPSQTDGGASKESSYLRDPPTVGPSGRKVGTRPQPHNKDAKGPAQSLQATVSAFARFFAVMQEQFKNVQIRHDQLSKQVSEDQAQQETVYQLNQELIEAEANWRARLSEAQKDLEHWRAEQKVLIADLENVKILSEGVQNRHKPTLLQLKKDKAEKESRLEALQREHDRAQTEYTYVSKQHEKLSEESAHIESGYAKAAYDSKARSQRQMAMSTMLEIAEEDLQELYAQIERLWKIIERQPTTKMERLKAARAQYEHRVRVDPIARLIRAEPVMPRGLLHLTVEPSRTPRILDDCGIDFDKNKHMDVQDALSPRHSQSPRMSKLKRASTKTARMKF